MSIIPFIWPPRRVGAPYSTVRDYLKKSKQIYQDRYEITKKEVD